MKQIAGAAARGKGGSLWTWRKLEGNVNLKLQRRRLMTNGGGELNLFCIREGGICWK